jgi:flagellar biosynthetic protein FliP
MGMRDIIEASGIAVGGSRPRPILRGTARVGRWVAVGAALFPVVSWAQPGLPAVSVSDADGGGQTYTLSIQLLFLMTALTLLPGLLVTMTAFTRVVIVLAILRQALGTMNTPSNQVLMGLSLFLTLFVMAPVFERVNEQALQPYLAEEVPAGKALQQARIPVQEFMLAQTRQTDLALFAEISGRDGLADRDSVPFSMLVPAFITSELKTAFQIGFILFIPFLVIDLVVASILMGMGMVMLSPMMVSFPFKILLFVLVDGWSLVMGTLASSFYVA